MRESAGASFRGIRAVLVLEQIELHHQRLELGAGELPIDAPHQAGQMQPARMTGRGLEQAFKARAQIGRAADVRLGVRIGAIQRKHCLGLRQLCQRGLGVGRVEDESLGLTRHSRRENALHGTIIAVPPIRLLKCISME